MVLIRLTVSLTLRLAPFFIKINAAEVWPLLAASIKGVEPL